ncbi:hypothetical protein F0169_00720 [Pseudomonas sp. MAFF 212408]|uniref:Uncharacterized protein n=1 Tax=Pseudomonas kitaguniensis TaxID=2607908 RepID=A0A5N7KF86_9PSED|nr:hypothetical protein [Pseudomonas kitaguniensis]
MNQIHGDIHEPTTSAIPTSADNADQMNLPEGKTCGECVHCKRCTAMFGHIPADESCDWSPSRFREAVPVAVSA